MTKIYTDYKNELGYEGEAILLERISIDCNIFHSDIDLIFNQHKGSDLVNKHQKEVSRKIKFIDNLLKIDTGLLSSLMKKLYMNHRKTNVLYDIITTYYNKHNKSASIIKTLSNEISIDFLIKYVQQKLNSYESPQYYSEKWLVEFPKQSDLRNNVLFNTEFRTTRKIRFEYDKNEFDIKCSEFIELKKLELIEDDEIIDDVVDDIIDTDNSIELDTEDIEIDDFDLTKINRKWL
jgi:hypothetical protein